MSAQNPQVVDSSEFIPLLDYSFSGDNATVERKRTFILAYRDEGSIYHAAQVTRINRKTAYRWIESDPQFAEALEDSKEDCYDKAETSVFKKALNGDSLLLMFYLKAHRHKFRDKVSVDIDSIRDEIQEKIAKLGVDRVSQLPSATTQFIDMDTVQGRSESAECVESMQFPLPSSDSQKDSTNE